MKQLKYQCDMMTSDSEIIVRKNPIINNLFKEFTCTICLHLFKDPVTVSLCKHTYCQDCLKQWKVKSDQSNGKTFKCPLCKNVTANRSYYSNEKYALVVNFLVELNTYMESSRYTDNSSVTSFHQYAYRKVILEKYLNECIKYKLDYENEGPEVKIDLSNKSSTNINNKENNTGDGDGDADDAVIITESEENEYILNICSTAENINIINKLENDFIEDLEKETNAKDVKENSRTTRKKKDTNETKASTSKMNKSDSPATKTGWERMKTINRSITKKTGKYRRLKVTEKKPNIENKERRRSPRTSTPRKETILGDFEEYLEEKNNLSKDITEAPIVIPTNSEKSLEIIEDDDIFLRSTQILQMDNLNSEVSIIKLKRKSSENIATKEETTIKKQKTPEKINTDENNVIVVSVDVHHSNDSVVNLPISRNESKELVFADIIENSEEQVKATRSSKAKQKSVAIEEKIKPTKSPKPASAEDVHLLNRNKEFKENLKEVSELKKSAQQSIEQILKESDNIISQYSNCAYNSDSLFSSESPEKHPKKEETKQKQKLLNDICSAPTLENPTSRESITFYNTAIPCLEKIKTYYQQLKTLSEQFTEHSSVLTETKSNENKVFANIEAQTDILRCPTCTYTFNLKSASNIPRNESQSSGSSINLKSATNIPRKELQSSGSSINLKSATDIPRKVPQSSGSSFDLKNASNNPRTESESSIHLKKTSEIPSKESDQNSEDFNAYLEDIKQSLSKNQTKDSLPPLPEDDVLLDDAKKKRFKRIRTPTDSDSDESSENSKKSRSNSYQSKLLYREDIDVCFHSTTSQMYSNTEEQNNKSNYLETNNKTVENSTPVKSYNKSSEDTLLYLEQQYKNPIDLPLSNPIKKVPEKCATNPNLDNLLSGIDVSTFENDFTITHKNTDQLASHQLNQRTELSASLFTETQVNQLNTSINNVNNANQETTNNQMNDITTNIDLDDSIVEDSCDSDDIFDDDIVDTTPQKIVDHIRINETSTNKNENKCNTSQSKYLSNSQLELSKLQIGNPLNLNPNVTSMTPDFLPLSNIDLNCGFFDNSKFITKTQTTQQSNQQTQNVAVEHLKNNIDAEKSLNLKPILLVQNDEFSPLQIVKQPHYAAKNKSEPAKHQSSILSYLNATPQTQLNIARHSQMQQNNHENVVIERCESPVLNSRPTPAAATAAVPVILCTSRLQSKENSDIMTYASRLNARFSNVFNKNVTHLIVKVDENNCVVDQTIKYVLAIAHGIWVVSYSWFKNSLHTNRLLPEESYEVLDMSGIPGPQLSRLRRRDCPLFRDFIFYIADPVATASRADLEDVIVNLGGAVIRSPKDFQNYPEKHCLILSEGKCCENINQYEIFKDKYQIMAVDIEWLSETVGQYKITSVRPYALCTDDNIENYGYPSELIAPIPESQNETLYGNMK